MFDRQYIVPTTASVLMGVIGAILAVQPIFEPGYVHPVALTLAGLFFAMVGTGSTVACIGFAIAEPRPVATGRGSYAEDVCDESCDWVCRHASDRANSVR